jgi:hypothetical protein
VASLPAHLVRCSPCAHGKRLSVKAALPGSTVWDPACTDSRGAMRPHLLPARPTA